MSLFLLTYLWFLELNLHGVLVDDEMSLKVTSCAPKASKKTYLALKET